MSFVPLSSVLVLLHTSAAAPPVPVSPAVDRLEASSAAPLRVLRDTPLAPPSLVRGFSVGPFDGTAVDAALAFLDGHGPGLGLVGPEGGWRLEDERNWRGRTRVRLGRTLAGLPVLGEGVVVQVTPDRRVDLVAARIRDAAPGGAPDPVPAIDPAAATRIARAVIPGGDVDAPLDADLDVGTPVLALLPGARGLRLVWQVSAWADIPPATWRVRVDARSGEVLDVADLRMEARGRVYDGSPVYGEPVDVDLEGLPADAADLTGDAVDAWSFVVDADGELAAAHPAVPDANGDFLYDPLEPSFDDPFSSVNAYFHLTRMTTFFEETWNHVFDARTDVFTNYQSAPGEPYDNGYFTTSRDGAFQIVIGQGSVDLAYDCDVLDHEFGHGIVDDLTAVSAMLSYPFGFDEYGWNIAPHAMNEGTADYWSSTVAGDSHSAEYFGQGLGYASALRELDNDATCPASVYGEPHDDGLVIGGTEWEIRTLLGATTADDLVYGALGIAPLDPSFRDMAEAFVAAGQALVDDGVLTAADLEAVQGIVDARGLSKCGRSIDLADGVVEEGLWVGADIMAGYVGSAACDLARNLDVDFPLPFQYSFTTPPASAGEMESLTFEIAYDTLSGTALDDDDDLEYGLYLRKDDLVTFETFNPFGSFMQYTAVKAPVGFDLAVDDSPTKVVLRPTDADLPLEPDTTYHLVFSGLNCPTLRYQITATLAMVPEPEDKACGCAPVPGNGRARGGLLLGAALGLALGVSRRGRPRRASDGPGR